MLNRIKDGSFHEWFIPDLVAGLGAESYLELGLYEGVTIKAVKESAPDCRCYGVDSKEVLIHGIIMFKMNTEEFWRSHAAAHGPFDITFIDADHSAEASWNDFRMALEYASPDGLVILHDTNPLLKSDTQPGYSGDCWKTAETIHMSGYEAVTLPYNPGLTIVRKRVQWGPGE